MNQERRKQVRRQADRDMLARLQGLMTQQSEESRREMRHRRRHAIRHHCQVRIALKISQSAGGMDTWTMSEHPIKGRILDLSFDGCSLFTEHQPEIGQQLSLVIELRHAGQIKTTGLVRWTKTVPQYKGFASGVQFDHIDEKQLRQLQVFLKEMDQTAGL